MGSKKSILLFVMLISNITLLFAQDLDWKAKWIGIPHSEKDTNLWICYRKQFKLHEAPSSAFTKIATDSKYWLWINGKLVVFEGELKRGPNPSDTSGYKMRMQSIKENFNKKFWNGKAYKSLENKGVTDDRGNGLAILAGIADSTKYNALLEIFNHIYINKRYENNKFSVNPFIGFYDVYTSSG